MRGSLELLSGILTRIGIYKDWEGIFELLAAENAIKRKCIPADRVLARSSLAFMLNKA
jgi:hypothetical protein